MMIRENEVWWPTRGKFVRMKRPRFSVCTVRTCSAESPASRPAGVASSGYTDIYGQCKSSRWLGCTYNTVRDNFDVCPGWQDESCLGQRIRVDPGRRLA